LYFIAIVAPEEVNKQVVAWKQFMLQEFGCKVALRSPAHITLVPPFNMPKERESELLILLEDFSSAQPPLEISLKDFDCFRPRVIYVNVVQSTALNVLQKRVTDLLIETGFPIKQDTRPFHPHLTIANRDLDRKDFGRAWEHFKNIKYSTAFSADAIRLLRSGVGGWEILPASTTERPASEDQGEQRSDHNT
jgi:2'-5' RNA ligase